MATSPFIISFFTLNLFLLLVFAASFIGSFILNYFDDSASNPYSFSYWFYDPLTASRDLIAYAVRVVDETAEDTLMTSPNKMDWSRSTPYKMNDSQPGILLRLARRFVLGITHFRLPVSLAQCW
jgi:hypothetical protein